MLMDRERRLLQASPAAYRLLSSCQALRLVHGVICAESTALGAHLAAAFRAVLTGQEPERALRLGGDETGDTGLEIRLVLLQCMEGQAQVIATVRVLADRKSTQLKRAIGQFGLTPAEGRLLHMLCGGASVPQAAIKLGVAKTTARTHLQRIFDKSGARRQSDLQRLIFAPMLSS
ncbi:helix-turn-helix transcriptional regulator [Sphingomonas sp. UYAg733]